MLRRIKVTVDGRVVAALKPRETATVELAPGAHVLTASMDWARSPQLHFEIAPGGAVSVQVSLPFASVFKSFYKPNGALSVRLKT